MIPQKVRFYSLNYCFFYSSSVVNPASTVIDMSQENTKKPNVSPEKVDWAQILKISYLLGMPFFLIMSKHHKENFVEQFFGTKHR